MVKKGLNAITPTTYKLWNKVIEKYGSHSYILGVNGLDQVVLSKGYTEDIALGTKAVNAKCRELLKD